MFKSSNPLIKRERKKALFMRELSSFIDRIAQDEPLLKNIYLTRVDLSADCGICYLYFGVVPGLNITDEAKETECLKGINILKLYKPSMRKNLAHEIPGRYTPDLIFLYDEKKDKIDRVNLLLDQVHQDLADSSEDSEE